VDSASGNVSTPRREPFGSYVMDTLRRAFDNERFST